MTGTVHALLGAAVGGCFRRRWAAFLAGMVSHAVGDALPHGEIPAAVDGLMAASVVARLGSHFGADSPQVAGALGGVFPDLEHGLSRCGIIQEHKKVFPTHGRAIIPHGRKTGNPLIQLAIAGAAVALMTAADRRRRDSLCRSGCEKDARHNQGGRHGR
ncbi:MAG: hypothetical protein ACUVTZ_11810 [Armatimonadota bacterium]